VRTASCWWCHAASASCRMVTRAFGSDVIRTEVSIFVLTRFLHANRRPPTDQVRGHASLENALDHPAHFIAAMIFVFKGVPSGSIAKAFLYCSAALSASPFAA